jgi:hypothetical protein
MEDLAAQALPTVPHLSFSIFNISVPNLIVWGVIIVILVVGAWARLPRFMERGRGRDGDKDREA